MVNNSIEFLDRETLLLAITHSQKEIAILVGSPLSSKSKNSIYGVPNVPEMTEIVEKYISNISDDLLERYREQTKSASSIDNYQRSFSFVKNIMGQDAVNNIIENATKQCVKEEYRNKSSEELNKSHEAWEIPEGTSNLAKSISLFKQINGPIITTNFDPLISLSLKKIGISSHQTITSSDGDIKQHRTIDEKNIQVIHLHGYWTESETLHSANQLEQLRPKLKSSLSSIVKNKTLLVIAYGGWDDVFMQALTQLTAIEDEKIDILWAFYESDTDLINTRYQKLFNSVRDANIKGRFRAFIGIDCHTFFQELNEKAEKIKIKHAQAPTECNEYQDQPKKNVKNIKKWFYHYEDAHDHIRETEKFQFNEILSKYKVINLVSEWGLAKLAFVRSFFNKDHRKLSDAYYIDLENCRTREEILSAAKNSLGVELLETAILLDGAASVIIFDNVEDVISNENEKTVYDILLEICNALTEFNTGVCAVIISGNRLTNDNHSTLELAKLNDYDIKNYIEHHSESRIKNCTALFLEKIIQMSGGIPMKIDRILSELRVASFDEVIDNHLSLEKNDDTLGEPIPFSIRKIIGDLARSKNPDDIRTYNILKTLTVLSSGDTFSNIKKIMPKLGINANHLSSLIHNGLISSIDIIDNPLDKSNINSSLDIKIISAPPAIRDFIFGSILKTELSEIIQNAARCHFGEGWRNGRVKFHSSIKQLLNAGNRNIGSTHLISIQLLRDSVYNGNSKGINSAVLLINSFLICLDSESRFKEIIYLSEELFLTLRNHPEKFNTDKIGIIYGKALRMLKQYEKSKKILIELTKDSILDNNIKSRAYLNIALIAESQGDSESALKNAQLAMKHAKHRDKTYQNSEIIIANLDKINKIENLRKKEKSARSKKQIMAANNIAIKLVNEEISESEKISYCKKIISSDGDQYNKYRIIGHYYNTALKCLPNYKISNEEKSILYSAYRYAINQRMDNMLKASHNALWNVINSENDIPKLISLFKLSSLYWRISGDSKSEKFYATSLSSLIMSSITNENHFHEERYTKLRLNQLS